MTPDNASAAMRKCPVCGRETNNLSAALWEHAAPYRAGQWQYLNGNMRAFGPWDGFWSTVCLASPLFNMLRHWKHRKSSLSIGDGDV